MQLLVQTGCNQVNTKFTCPICRMKSRFEYHRLGGQMAVRHTEMFGVSCHACGKISFWIKENDGHRRGPATITLVHPIVSEHPEPHPDMPEEIIPDYEEARLVSIYSAKAACALLRLALQKLCVSLGEPGKDLNTDIRSLAKKDDFSQRLVTAADTLRIVGNKAVHPGEMSDDDINEICAGLFRLINLIIEQGITKPRELDELYRKVPEGPRNAAEAADAKSKI